MLILEETLKVFVKPVPIQNICAVRNKSLSYLYLSYLLNTFFIRTYFLLIHILLFSFMFNRLFLIFIKVFLASLKGEIHSLIPVFDF